MGFVSKRQALDATRKVITLFIMQGKKKRTPYLLLSVIAEKAFNSVHWLFISMVLQKFGFQGTILSAILALYSTPSAKVNASGPLSKSFAISNST